jgi:hypothetical protein
MHGVHPSAMDPALIEEIGKGAAHDCEITLQLFRALREGFPPGELDVIELTVQMFTNPRLIGCVNGFNAFARAAKSPVEQTLGSRVRLCGASRDNRTAGASARGSSGTRSEAVAAATIAHFRADPRNEFMPLVEPAMKEILLRGEAQTLFEAYDLGCLQNPLVTEIKMARNRPQPPVNPYLRPTAVQQSRNAAKAIGGAPSTGNGKPKSYDSAGSVEDDVRAAVARQRGN